MNTSNPDIGEITYYLLEIKEMTFKLNEELKKLKKKIDPFLGLKDECLDEFKAPDSTTQVEACLGISISNMQFLLLNINFLVESLKI